MSWLICCILYTKIKGASPLHARKCGGLLP
jgi:hypothetical protein